jgi:hypothetical protein
LFNRLAATLIEYELLFHKAWFDSVEKVQAKLGSPVLLQDPQTAVRQTTCNICF